MAFPASFPRPRDTSTIFPSSTTSHGFCDFFERRVKPASGEYCFHEDLQRSSIVAVRRGSDNVVDVGGPQGSQFERDVEPCTQAAIKFGSAYPSPQNVIIFMRFSDSRTGAHNSIGANRTVGEWLSLVEHLVRDQGVGGSNPLSPTISNQQLPKSPGSRTSKKDLHWLAGTGCAKNSRHTVAAAMLTASTLSSHHVRL